MRIAYYALHYGAEYLAWSIRSIQDAVDEIHVLYTDVPSYGHTQGAVCPDSEVDLRRESERFLTKPLVWHRGHWSNEGEHRNAIRDIARVRGANLVLTVDADELWDPTTAKAALDFAEVSDAGNTLVRFCHFWRSFNWVCDDPCMPVRVLNLNHAPNTVAYLSPQEWPVFHFGYAQSLAIMQYKWTCHGHQSELLPRWMEEKFLGWGPGMKDVHPTNRENFWEPKPVDQSRAEKLKELLGDHPNFEKDLIT